VPVARPGRRDYNSSHATVIQRIGQRKSIHRKLLKHSSPRASATLFKGRFSSITSIGSTSGRYGIEAASSAYFGKHAADLSLAEAAILAGIIRSPLASRR
jgi:penicillin-binding protein 1A